MAKKTPVHVRWWEDRWAVVREGNDRATSVHATQAEAEEAGREIARRDQTSFSLHAKDGHIRDSSYYGEEPVQPEEGLVSDAGAVVDAATSTTGAVVGQASGGVGETIEGLGQAATGANQDRDSSIEEKRTDDAEEVDGLPYEERYADYEVYDRDGERLGIVDTLFLDENDQPEYLGLKMGLLGTRSTLLPWAAVAGADEEGRRLELKVDKETVENGPAFEDDQEITPDLEREIHAHYGFEQPSGAGDRGVYGSYHPEIDHTATTAESDDLGTSTGATAAAGSHHHEDEGIRQTGSDPEAEDEIRVQRVEEELVTGTHARETGALRVRKRVRIEHKTVEVPVRREEVHVERVPVSGEASETEIGEDEIVVPIIEEEVVISKRPVVKEEVRIRRDVVESTEIVEEDVRREEIDIEDEPTRRDT